MRTSTLAAAAAALALCATIPAAPQQPRPPAAATPAQGAELDRARTLIAGGRFTQAEALLRAYLVADSASVAAHRMLAYCLLRENRPREALPEYTRAAQIAPPTAEDFKNVAQAYALLGDWTEAARWISRSVQTDSTDAEAWYSFGRIRYTQQRFVDAVDCFEKTLALAPRSMKAENNLGLALEGLNRNDEAVEAYRKAIAWADARQPASGQASPQAGGIEQPLLNLAIVLVHRNQLDEAIALLQRAVLAAPRDPRIHEQLGHVYLQKEDLSAAQGEFEQAVALDPGNSALHFLLGQTYRREGLGEKARQEFARAAAIMGTHSSP